MKSKMFVLHSIKAQVTLSTLAIFVFSLWALSYYASRMLEDDMQHMLGEQQFAAASLVAHQVNDELVNRIWALELTAAEIGTALMEKPFDLQSRLQQRPLVRGMFNGGVWVSGPDGTVIASDWPARSGGSAAERDYLMSVLQDNKPAFSKPISGEVWRNSIFATVVPIHDASGNVIGALVGLTDLGKPNFLDNLVNRGHAQQGGFLLVAPKQRLIITATDRALVVQAMPALGVNQMFDRYADGYEGYGVSVSERGLEELSAAKGIPVAGWVLGVTLPSTEVFAPVHGMQRRMLLATLALTLLAGVLTGWTLRRQLAPVSSTVRALAKLSDPSQLQQPLPISREDEIGNLIEGFNRLMVHRQALQDDLQATLNASPDLIFDVGIDGRLYAVHTRSAHLLIAPAQTLTGKLVQDVLPADAAATIMDTLSEANARGYSSGKMICLALPTGVHWFELSGARKLPLPGQMQRFIVISRDISERNRAEKDLRQALASVEKANQSKSRFLAAASHDLRQPMAALALYTGMLGGAVKPGQDKLVSHMQTCVDSLSGMLDDLLDLSKFDAGVLVPTMTDFSVDGLCASLQTLYQSKAAEKGLRLRCRHSAQLALHTDQRMMHRLVGNLIDNAVAYTVQGGVLVATRRRSGRLWLEVWDTGVGMEKNQIPLIFEEFRQLGDGARNRGSGLGLSIVSKLGLLLGLEIRVRSWPGRGSVFSVSLPEAGTPVAALVVPPTLVASQTFTIGVVEDNAVLLRALVLMLQWLGHTVFSGVTGAQLLERLAGQKPDILVCDYRLGAGETGLDVIAAARVQFGPRLPAIILTGDTAPDVLRTIVKQGIPVYCKPVASEVLETYIRQAVEGS